MSAHHLTSPSEEALRQRAQNWAQHWVAGSTHSCTTSYGELYGGAISEFWRSEFAALRAGHRILDLATGSGAIPRLLLAMCADLDVSIDAVDIVQTPAPWLAAITAGGNSAVHFHGGVNLEALPFEAGAFDLVTSQYGIEYAALDRALKQACAQVAPGGRFAAVLHHHRSIPVQLAGIEIGHIDWLCSSDGLLPAAQALIDPLNRARDPQGRAQLAQDSQANRARDQFNRLQDALRTRSEHAPYGADVLDEARDAIAQVVQLALAEGAAPANRAWQQLHRSMQSSRQRLRDLVDAALDDNDIQLMQRVMQSAGLTGIETSELLDAERLMGWTVRACAPAT